MAGSFDSHFARHNMMWQCQLSQPDCRCYRVDGYSLLKRLPLHPLIGPRCPMQSVGQWLDSIGLVQYENHLLANGFDNVQFMVSVVCLSCFGCSPSALSLTLSAWFSEILCVTGRPLHLFPLFDCPHLLIFHTTLAFPSPLPLPTRAM